MFPVLVKQLKHDEGFRAFPYLDITDHLTIGYGRNIQERGISSEEAEFMLLNDITICHNELCHFEWYLTQPDHVKMALINMCFNMGLTKLLTFKKMIAALEKKDYTKAAKEALNSKWAEQVKDRAVRVAHLMRDGL